MNHYVYQKPQECPRCGLDSVHAILVSSSQGDKAWFWVCQSERGCDFGCSDEDWQATKEKKILADKDYKTEVKRYHKIEDEQGMKEEEKTAIGKSLAEIGDSLMTQMKQHVEGHRYNEAEFTLTLFEHVKAVLHSMEAA